MKERASISKAIAGAVRSGGIAMGLAFYFLLPLQGFGAVKRYVPPTAQQVEAELLEMINREREILGRKPLLQHPVLQEIARSHSAKMAAEGRLSHDFPGWPRPEQKMQQGGLCFLASAENVARGQTPFAGPMHGALMASFRHRVNILDGRMLQVGIGACRSGADLYVSEEFAAIIDCPVAEKAMVFIENELCRLCKEKFGVSPAILTEARLPAMVSAQQYLFNNPIELQAFNDRGMQGINVCYNDMAPIMVELKKVVDGGRIASLAVGVAWGRSVNFPGGAYSVCLLLFK